MKTDVHSAPRVQVFGELRLTRAGHEVDLGAPRQRLLFAELLAARGRPVGMDHLIDSLWGDQPPASAMNQVHRYVGELRRGFEPALKAREVGSYVVPTPSGYRLLAGAVSSDLADFYVQANEAAQKAAHGAPSATSDYRRLLEVITNRAFTDLPFGAASRPQFAELERDRLDVVVAAADHALVTGEVDQLGHLVEGIAASSPADERLQARTIRLLAARGRTADAHALFESTRLRLADDFGISPGADLKAALAALLDDDTRAAGAIPLAPSGVDTLPPKSVSFLSRPEQESLLDEARGAAEGGGALVVISGMAGIGKTTLATNWAHQVRASFPGGRIYIDLRGFTPDGLPVATSTALETLLLDLGVDVQGADSSVARRRELYQAALSRGRYLVLLDNARDADQVRALLPTGPGSMAVVTSRNTLTGLVMHEGATQIALGRLSLNQAQELLGRRLGSRGAQEPRAVAAIVQMCAGLPLALTIVAARANLRRSASLADLVAELVSAREKLTELRLDAADADVRAAFGWSYRLLSAAAARTFTRLSVHPGPQLSLAAIASISGSTVVKIQSTLDELLAANMLIRSSAGLFEMHDLMRLFAKELLTGPDLLAAQNGFAGYCSGSMRAAFRSATGMDAAFSLPWTTSAAFETFATDAEAIAWYWREQTALGSVLGICRARKLDAEFASIVLNARPLRGYFGGQGAHGIATPEEVLKVALRTDSASLQAEAYRDVSYFLLRAGDRAGHKASIDRAIALFRQDRNVAGEGFVLRGLVTAALIVGELDGIRDAAVRLVVFARTAGIPGLLADALSLRASVAVNLRDWQSAIDATDEVFRLAPEAFEVQNLTLAANRAIALDMLGRWSEAYELLQSARAPVEQDTIVSWGWISEMVVATANTQDVSATRVALERYDEFMSNFGELIRFNYAESEYAWITERIESTVRAVGVARIGAETSVDGSA